MTGQLVLSLAPAATGSGFGTQAVRADTPTPVLTQGDDLGAGRRLKQVLGRLVAVPLLIALVAANWLHAEAMIRAEPVPPSVPIADLLVRELPPGAALTIAADPTFHLERELFFRTGDAFRMKTAWWDDAWPDLEGEPLVIYMPSAEDLAKLDERFPGGRLFELEKHALWLPPE